VADALDEVLAAMQGLLDTPEQAPEARREDEGNFRCVGCVGCNDCRFCVDSRDCNDCTYCESCVGCTGCTQSRGCRDCERSSHSHASRACDDCSYVTLCVGCAECVHCFGCVGLSGAEFCILNEKLARKDYQARIGELRTLLERRMSQGWLPPWLGDEPEPARIDELAGFDDLDGIGSALPRDPVHAGLVEHEPIAAPQPALVTQPPVAREPVLATQPVLAAPELLAPLERPPATPPSRSLVRAVRPARAAEPELPSEPAVAAERNTSVLVGRRPVR
jgi:hypothetical protein